MRSRVNPSNYQPISVPSLIYKVMESVLNGRMPTYLEDNDLLSDRQYGFRWNRLAGDLLVYAMYLLAEVMEGHGEALAMSLDISKAFDTTAL